MNGADSSNSHVSCWVWYLYMTSKQPLHVTAQVILYLKIPSSGMIRKKERLVHNWNTNSVESIFVLFGDISIHSLKPGNESKFKGNRFKWIFHNRILFAQLH